MFSCYNILYIPDDKSSNTFDEEVEIENIPDENDSHSYVCKEEEEEEENWDATDEVNDNFDPTCKPVCSSCVDCVDYTFAPY